MFSAVSILLSNFCPQTTMLTYCTLGRGLCQLALLIDFLPQKHWQSDEELGLNMADFGPKPPYINSSPYALLHIKNYGRKAKMQTEVIPDDVLWPLFNVCVEYVEKLSPYILALKRRLDAAEAEYAKYPLVPGGYRPTAPKRLQALFKESEISNLAQGSDRGRSQGSARWK